MFVQKVAPPGSRVGSWTVLGEDDVPVVAIERYLSYLSDIERSPNTVKAYAHDLKDYFVFLGQHGVAWDEVGLEDVGEFVAWLRLPPADRAGLVAVLPSWQPHVGAATINRKLSAVSSFYVHQARHGVDLGDLLARWVSPGGRAAWKPFLHHSSKGQPQKRRAIALKTSRRLPRVLTAAEVQAILDACTRLRDRSAACQWPVVISGSGAVIAEVTELCVVGRDGFGMTARSSGVRRFPLFGDRH